MITGFDHMSEQRGVGIEVVKDQNKKAACVNPNGRLRDSLNTSFNGDAPVGTTYRALCRT